MSDETKGAGPLRIGEDDPRIAAAVEELIARGVLARVELGGPDEQRWSDCDLAILAEHRLGDRTDPRALDAVRRTDWYTRAATHGLCPPSLRRHDHSCWILAEGERVGIVALGRSCFGGTATQLSSLYILPTARRRGHARRVVVAIRDALGERGLGVRLDTCWAWQDVLRFYLRLGMCVRTWKRDLTLQWRAGDPPLRIAVGEAEASLAVERAGEAIELCRARREGESLVFDGLDEADGREHVLVARSTFALVLAMHGWPLVRSPEAWARSRWSDLVHPEALAYKIAIWEAWDRDHGWFVDTPRIPGLEYPTWDELEARWASRD